MLHFGRTLGGVHSWDDTFSTCPPTLGQYDVQSLEILLIIPKDQPFKGVKAEVEVELDPFVDELNEVLTFDGVASEEGEITTDSINH